MTKAEKHAVAAQRKAALHPLSEVDFALSIQLIVGWAGIGTSALAPAPDRTSP